MHFTLRRRPWQTCSFRHQLDVSGKHPSHAAMTREDYSLIFPPPSIARFSYSLNWGVVERTKMSKLRKVVATKLVNQLTQYVKTANEKMSVASSLPRTAAIDFLAKNYTSVKKKKFAPSLYIFYAADFNYLIRGVIVTYILLDISVVNWHATSAYKCELLAVTWHYLPSVRLDNADQ